MWKRIKQLDIMIAVASSVFGILVAAVLRAETSLVFATPIHALLAGVTFIVFLSIISITTIGVIARKHDTEIAAINTELCEINRAMHVANVAHALGIAAITAYWREFIDFEGDGKSIKQRMDAVEAPATWYLLTINAQGFMKWDLYLKNAFLRRGIDIKWVFHDPDKVELDDALKAQQDMLNSPHRTIADLRNIKGWVMDWANESYRLAEALDDEKKKRIGTIEVYESMVPHFYLAFLSVPQKHKCEEQLIQAPPGSFGVVQLYQMFPSSFENRWAVYLEAPGTVLDYHYRSIVKLFDESVVSPPYIRRIWSSKEKVEDV